MKAKLQSKIEKITPNLVVIFLYLQPFFDMLAAYLIKNNISNYLTSTIRLIFMFYMIFYLLLARYENKKKIITYVILLITTILIHTLTIFIYKGQSFIFFELKTTLSTYYFVFLLISFLALWQNKSIKKSHIRNILMIYLIFTFVPGILNISYKSYDNSKIGKVGWFYSANVLGSIIIILFSTLVSEIKKYKISFTVILFTMLLYIIFTLGTKTPVLGLCIIIGINLLYLIYVLIKTKSKKVVYIPVILIIALITSALIVPKTNFYKNLQTHLTYIKNKEIDKDMKDFIDHFIFSTRLKNEEETRKYYKKSHTLEKVFGIGYIENYEYDLKDYKVIEIDYFDILYKEGIVGFIMYFLPVIYLIIKILKNIKINFKDVNEISSILLILLITLFQGHMFITPQASIYISLIFVLIYNQNIKNNKGVQNEK